MPKYKILFLSLLLPLVAAGCSLESDSSGELMPDVVDKVSAADVLARNPEDSSTALDTTDQDIVSAILEKYYEANSIAYPEIRTMFEVDCDCVNPYPDRMVFENHQYDFGHQHIDDCNCRFREGLYTLNGFEESMEDGLTKIYIQSTMDGLVVPGITVFNGETLEIQELTDVVIDGETHYNVLRNDNDGGSSGMVSESTVVKFVSPGYNGTIVVDDVSGQISSSVLALGNNVGGDPEGEISCFFNSNPVPVLSYPYKDFLVHLSFPVETESLSGYWTLMSVGSNEIFDSAEFSIMQSENGFTVYDNDEPVFTGTVESDVLTCTGWDRYGLNAGETFTINRLDPDLLYMEMPVSIPENFIVFVRN